MQPYKHMYETCAGGILSVTVEPNLGFGGPRPVMCPGSVPVSVAAAPQCGRRTHRSHETISKIVHHQLLSLYTRHTWRALDVRTRTDVEPNLGFGGPRLCLSLSLCLRPVVPVKVHDVRVCNNQIVLRVIITYVILSLGDYTRTDVEPTLGVGGPCLRLVLLRLVTI